MGILQKEYLVQNAHSSRKKELKDGSPPWETQGGFTPPTQLTITKITSRMDRAIYYVMSDSFNEGEILFEVV